MVILVQHSTAIVRNNSNILSSSSLDSKSNNNSDHYPRVNVSIHMELLMASSLFIASVFTIGAAHCLCIGILLLPLIVHIYYFYSRMYNLANLFS